MRNGPTGSGLTSRAAAPRRPGLKASFAPPTPQQEGPSSCFAGDLTRTSSAQTSPAPVAAPRPRLPIAHSWSRSLPTARARRPGTRGVPTAEVGAAHGRSRGRAGRTRQAPGGSPRRLLFHVLKSPASRGRGAGWLPAVRGDGVHPGLRCAGRRPPPWVLGGLGHRSDFLREQAAPL